MGRSRRVKPIRDQLPHLDEALQIKLRGGAILTCQKALMIHPYIDRELDETQIAEVEQHLEQCPACKHNFREQFALHSALRDASFYYRAPADFKRRIHTASSSEVISLRQVETIWARRLRARAKRDITVPKGI